MLSANVKLSPDEMLLVTNAEWILTKNRIIQKLVDVYGEIVEQYKIVLQDFPKIPKDVLAVSPKIYRGEQYRGLPYVMLDFPRYFTKDAVFAIRSFFWWGNCFSITLHVAGKYTSVVNLHTAFKNNWYIGINKDPWQHHCEVDNYVLIKDINNIEQYQECQYIKLAKKIPLQQWDNVPDFYIENFYEILRAISPQFPNL